MEKVGIIFAQEEELAALKAPLYSVEASGVVPAAAKEGLRPEAEGLVRTWLNMSETERAAAASKPAEPMYVRPPHITKATRKPWEI